MHGSNNAARKFDQEQAAPGRNYGYPNYYKLPSLVDRVSELRRAFPRLDVRPAHDYIRAGLPGLLPGAEGKFPLIRRSFFGKDPRLPMMRVAAVLKASGHSLYSWGFEHHDYLKPQPEMIDLLDQIGDEQEGDILIVDGQFGLRHAGENVYDVRNHCTESDYEFPAGAPELGCMLLTAPMRLSSPTDLLPMAPGECYSPGHGPDGARTPYFDFEKGHHTQSGNWNFQTRRVDDVDPKGRYGAVTLFAKKNK